MKKIQLLLLMLFCIPAMLFAQRDPLKWPFAKTSIWNMPIHNNAVYIPADIKDANNFEADEDVIIMSPNSASIQVQTNNAGWSGQDRCPAQGATLFSAPIPANWIFDNTVWYGRTPNAGAAILLPNGKIKQTQPFAKCSQNVATSLYVWSENLCELKGECIQGAHGGSGLSSIGGTIRYGELTAGIIQHALKINLWGKENFFKGNGGYRWPAIKADGGYNDSTAFNYYGGANPEMRIGALLAIYKDAVLTSVANNSLGIETEAGLIIARAMQNYGAYTVDNTAYDSYAFIIENGPDGIVRNEFKQKFGFDLNVFGSLNNSPWGRDLKRIYKSLYVVSNNTGANNIGGGPTTDSINRRAPLAPDFQAAISPRTLKVMPLGDSKTEGGGTNNSSAQNSWRGYLRTKLIRNGFGIDYVGDRSNIAAGDTIPTDNNHAGHGGYTIGPDIQKFCTTCETTGLFEHIQDWLPAANPDVVLLAVGVNDMFGAQSHVPGYARSAPDRYAALVNKILQLKPNVKIVAGTVEPVRYDVNWGGNPNDNSLGSLNARIKAIADSSLTDNIYFADIRNKMLVNFSAADFFDDVHLSAQGAKKNADAWLEAVIPVLNNVPNNAPPVCSITSPANNAGFAAPASITIEANATDSDGSIKNVAFYNGGVKIGEDSTAPYRFTWANVDEGAYLITAVATDNYFVTRVSAGVLVNVSSTDGYTKFTGTGIGSPGSFGNNGLTFSNALDGNTATYFDGASANGQWVGLDLGVAKIAKKIRYVPRATWTSRITGGKIQGANSADFSDAVDLFTITATTIDSAYNAARFTNNNFFQYYRFLSPNGGYGNIAEIEFWGNPNDPTNQPPVCNLINPADNTTLSAAADVLLSATASDADGTISKVEFYQGSTLLGTATAAPYDFVWSNVPVGAYSITAKATDNTGVTKSSPAVTVNVNPNLAGPVLYYENFDANTAAGWVATNGTWAPATAKYRSSNAGGEHTAYYGGRNFTNYTFTIDGFSSYGNDMGVIFNYQNASNYYLLAFNTNTKTASLKKKVGGTVTTIATRSFTGRGVGTTHSVYIKNAGNLTSIKINGDTICDDVSTTNFTSGKIGVYAYFNPTVFDNVLVISNNGSPTIAINSPVFKSIYTAPAVVPVNITITDPDTTLTKVDFYNKDSLIATKTTQPFDINLPNPTPGNYFLTAKATHSTGYAITSSLVAFTINPSSMQAPAVSIVSPANLQAFLAPATVPITASASDNDGTISKVDFYNGNTLIGSDTSSPYQINWANVKTGNYTILARATDNAGAVANSALVTINVLHPAPSASISEPANNDTITGLDLPITALASSTDGTIKRVDFFSDTTLLATDSISPYSYSLKVPAGTYNLYVKATDNVGASTLSDTVAVIVKGYVAGAENLLKKNAGFEQLAGISYANGAYNAIPGWSLFNSAYNNIGVSTGNAAEGGKKLQIINAGYGETAAADFATVSPGSVYALTVSLRKTASRSATVSSPAQILIKWYDSSGTFLNSVTSGNISGGPVTGWQTFTIVGTAPANAVKASAKVNVNFGTSPNTGLADFLVDNFVLYKLADGKRPIVSLVNPASDTSINVPTAPLIVQAEASDSDGTISKLDFFIDTVPVGSDATFPYTYNWPGITAGIYTLTVKATDNHGLTTTSLPITVTATLVPVISITGAAAPVIKLDSSYIVLSASPQIDGATIASVSFYRDSVLLGEVTGAPYSFKWINNVPGTYTFTAKALASTGHNVTSQPFTATLVSGKLTLTSVCSADPAATRRWRVTSTYTVPVGFTWNVHGTSQNGAETVNGGETNYFETITVAGPNTTHIFYGNNKKISKASSGQACGSNNMRSSQSNLVNGITTREMGDTAKGVGVNYHDGLAKSNGLAPSNVAVEKVLITLQIKAYPVPLSNGNLHIQINGCSKNEVANLIITDLLGRKILTRKLLINDAGNATASLSRSEFKLPGFYLATVSSHSIKQQVKMVIK